MPPPLPRTGPQCPNGLVPREAYRGDRVCVTPQAHEQTIADNVAAPSHTRPDGLCVPGFVWREARPDDHVCVTPQTRAQTQSDNQRVLSTLVPVDRPGIPHRGSIRRWPSHETIKVHT
ncbi:MAG TPA: hypothetical protein VGF36_14860, partial [Rhodopila sp.]